MVMVIGHGSRGWWSWHLQGVVVGDGRDGAPAVGIAGRVAESAHGHRGATVGCGFVDTDGERGPVFVEERLERMTVTCSCSRRCRHR